MAKRPHICFDRVLPRDVMRLQSTTRGRPGVLKALSPIGKTWLAPWRWPAAARCRR